MTADDKNALAEIISKYGDKVVYYKDTNRSSNGKSVHKFQMKILS